MLWYLSRMDKSAQRKLLQGQTHPKVFLTILSASYYIFSSSYLMMMNININCSTCNKVLPDPNLSATFFFTKEVYSNIFKLLNIFECRETT